ncbi:MAG: hypothetical protein MUF06_01270 [Pirellulaceae bacterium]|nr:hypothetical protein [Pirellulaceae bacterium]
MSTAAAPLSAASSAPPATGTSRNRASATAGGGEAIPAAGIPAAGGVHAAGPPRHSGWLVSPWFDALLIANIAWPLLLLVQWGEGFGGQAGLSFWQIYFITTPHRWITLALVFLDRDRFAQRKWAFLAVAAVVATLCLGVGLTTGTLTCLLAIDYAWNAWHFAAQHHGIYRIYGRLGETGRPAAARWFAAPRWITLEKWTLRLFLLYVILRVAVGTWFNPRVDELLQAADWGALLIPLALLTSNLLAPHSRRGGRLLYLASVLGLYSALLWAVHQRMPPLMLALATASALFHALEYLAIVGWSVQKRHGAVGSRMGLLGWLAPRWALAMALFVLILGIGGWLVDQYSLQSWLTLNVIVAFLHYAYDGMIWRQRAAA